MITLDHIGLDKITEIWSIRLNGVGVEDFNFGHSDIPKKIDTVWYEVHVTIDHSSNDGERVIAQVFPEYGEVEKLIRESSS